MSKFFLGLLLASTLLSPILAAAGEPPFQGEVAAFVVGQETEGDAVTSATDPLYFELAARPSSGEMIRTEVTLNGTLVFEENFELVADSGVPTGVALGEGDGVTVVVELLAVHPARLAYLRRASENGMAVSIRLLVGDVFMGSQPLPDLEARSAELRTLNLLPRDLRSTVSLKAQGGQVALSCAGYCDDDLDFCYEERCDFGASQSCLDACDRVFGRCLQACGICESSSTTQTTTTVVSTTPRNVWVCTRAFSNPSVTGTQRLKDRVTRRTVVTTTTNADCSETVTTQVSYLSDTCWQWVNFNSCLPFVTENPAANC